MASGSDLPREICPECGGDLVAGRIAVPIVGSLRFVYRLGTNEVATEVAAQLCGDCGRVRLQAKDPELIVRAVRASTRTSPRWSFGRLRGALHGTPLGGISSEGTRWRTSDLGSSFFRRWF
jgi:hypothetical protein